MLNQQSKILCIGEVLWDCLPQGNKPGGAPMNVALHLKKFGLNVSIASKVGKDKQGEELLKFIQKSGLKTDLIQFDDKLPTSEVKVHLVDSNKVAYEICEPVAWDNIQITNELKKYLDSTDIVVYGTLAARNEATAKTIHQILDNKSFNVIDVNLRPPYIKQEIVLPLLEKADLIKLNEDEIIAISQWFSIKLTDEEELIKWIADKFNCKIVCVTKGDKGAILHYDNQLHTHKGYKVEAVDTVGSGDAFLSGILYSLLNGYSPEKMLSFACASGALVATKAGATPEYTLKEIHAIIS